MVVCTCNPNTGEEEIGRSLEFSGLVYSDKLRSMRDPASKIRWVVPEEYFKLYFGLHTLLDMHKYTKALHWAGASLGITVYPY